MPVAPSLADILAQGLAEAQARRPELQFADGDVALAQLHAGAAMADAAIRFAAQAFKETFLDGAEGDALTALVDDRVNLQRKTESSAQVLVSFMRTSKGSGGTIPAGTQVGTANTPDGSQEIFTTDVPIAVGAGANGPFSVNATAVAAGRGGNVAAGKVARILSTLFDNTFSVTNAAAAGGGNDVESDPELRARARSYYGTLRRGTLDSLVQGALAATRRDRSDAGVRFARATEDPADGGATVLVADSDGGSTEQMVSDVAAELEKWRAAGAHVEVRGGQQLLLDLQLIIRAVRRGFTLDADVEGAIIEVVTARINTLGVEEVAYGDMIVGAAISVASDDLLSIDVGTVVLGGVNYSLPDVTPPPGCTLRAGTVTVKVELEAP